MESSTHQKVPLKMRRKKLKPTLRSIYHSPKYQPKVVLERLNLTSLSKYHLSKPKKQVTQAATPVTKVLPLPPRRKISIDFLKTQSVQENVVSSGSSPVAASRPKRKGSTASNSDEQEVPVMGTHKTNKSERLKARALSSGKPPDHSQPELGFHVDIEEPSRQRPSSCPPRAAVSSTSSVKKGNYEEDGFVNSADDISSREGTPDASSSSRLWPTPKIVSVSSMAVLDSEAKQRLRRPIIPSQVEAASTSTGTLDVEADQSIRQPTTTTSSPTKDQTTAEPPTKVVRLADDAEDAVPEAEAPQPAQLGFWDRERRIAGMRNSLFRLQDVVTRVSKVSQAQATKIRELQAKAESVPQVMCDPRCVELQRTLAILGIGDEIFVKLAGIISDSQPGTEFFNPKAAAIMNLIRDYTSLY
ncbi:uncharacterized protein LOC126474176 isoform X1 [Schistocerca serialis cubense]|uniref:uncharacterized protein LOC126474176 isoform X1 n=2 Tax=Schistocerca serialis cubense TaxID=2023355 RepID=UPI00214EEE34|nr:uncharacterized protein LOC126474176 isoform X1 [Schistocerca serialis cubense]